MVQKFSGFLALALFFCLSQTASSQTCDGTCSYTYPSSSEKFEKPARDGAGQLNDPDEIASYLNQLADLCDGADIYLIDCLAERFETLERGVAGLDGYRDAQLIFRETAQSLRAITQEHLDEQSSRVRIRSQDGTLSSSRPLSAITTAQRRTALSQAAAVLARAETQLLRSAETSGHRSLQYQQIAAAVGSNKVLLRSA